MSPRRSNGLTHRLLGLFGTGRSGSTWLGAIVNSHPDVAYRFEPFHRLRHDERIVAAYHQIEADNLSDNDLPQIYDALLRANPLTEKPPFFRKTYGRRLGKQLAWQVAAKVPTLHRAFEWAYAPDALPPLVFKEVTMERMMTRLLDKTSVRTIYLVRHPAAVAASELRGHDKGVMPSGRYTLLESILAEHDSDLAQTYVPKLGSLSDAEKSALLWRVDVERGVRAAQEHDAAMVLVYEDLCVNTHQRARDIMRHLQLGFHPQVDQFLQLSTSGETDGRLRSWEWSIDKYFSVFRDPAQSASKWKTQLDADQKAGIQAIVEDSTAYQTCFNAGYWDWG